MTNHFEDRCKAFVDGGQKIINDHFAKAYSSLIPNELRTSNGRRYVKIISVRKITTDGSDGQRSVWAFIDKTNGDVLKPASWAAPAKHARGNIYNSDNGLGNVSWTGPAYL